MDDLAVEAARERFQARAVADLGKITVPRPRLMTERDAADAVARLSKRALVSVSFGTVVLAMLLGFILARWHVDQPTFQTLWITLAATVGSFYAVEGAVHRVRWRTRAEAAARTGWATGVAQVDQYVVGAVAIDLEDDRNLRLSIPKEIHRRVPAQFRFGEVLVAGNGKAVTVLLTSGPMLIAAKAIPD
ncbi:hypothetical protein [Actinokineospora terrae]|uniref:hypothetical protein n=1 Tax=Actinokineospora terrae TaxID=155974 RepID=UPI000B80A461|nr:hypothetical protein [Actinokineospora terrae]